MPIVLDGTNGINTPDLESAGPISGTTGTFSGALRASGVAANIYPLVSGTAVASTSGTSIDFTGIPSWVKRITVMLSNISTNGTSNILVRIGDSGGIENTAYTSASWTANATNASSTTGFLVTGSTSAAFLLDGAITLSLLNSTTWVSSSVTSFSNGTNAVSLGSGSKTLSATLDQVRITTVNGTDTFDAGSINIMYE